MNDDAVGTEDQVLLQTIYELLNQRGAWPTFTAVDLRADHELGIEDAQAALVALSPRYVNRPWQAYGYSDNDEVRLTLRGVAACAGGTDDLARLSQLVEWTVALEQAATSDSEMQLAASGGDFAAHLGLPLSPPGGDQEQPTSEVVEARDLMGRLFVLADQLPHLWRGSSKPTEDPWLWQRFVDRRGIRPYRRLSGIDQLLAYVDQEDRERLGAVGERITYVYNNVIVSHGQSMSAPLALPDGELDVHMTLLRPEVVEACADLLGADRFDDAIFAAFRRLEHEVQQRTGSQAIGTELVTVAFRDKKDPIRISDREQDKGRLVELFAGAIGLFKGDRSHKDRPLLPCRSRRECLRLLAHASSLLDLLDRDVDQAPAVRGYRHDQGATLTLWVERAGSQVQVWLDERTRLDNVSYQAGTLVVDVGGIPAGEHRIHLVEGTRQGPAHTVWITLDPGQKNWYRVVEINIPLYADEMGQQQLQLAGVRLATLEAGVAGERIVVTRESYQVGHYVAWHWAASGTSTGPLWVRDRPGGPLREVWNEGGVFDGQPVAPSHRERLMKISIEPTHLLLRAQEKSPLRVMGHFTDGTATWTEPVDNPQVETSDERVAKFNGGKVFAKEPGTAVLRCLHGGCSAEASVEVAAHPSGTLTTYLSGLPPVAGIAWTPDGLVVSARGRQLWRAGTDGVYRLAAMVPAQLLPNLGTDTLAARSDGELAVRLLEQRAILVLHHDAGYRSSTLVQLTTKPAGTPMAFVWDEEDLIVALDTGVLQRVSMDGSTISLGAVPGCPIAVACKDKSLLVLGSPDADAAPELRFNRLWRLSLTALDTAPEDLLHDQGVAGLNGVAWTKDGIVLSDFDGGRIIELRKGRVEEMATGLHNPGQLAAAESGDLYVAEFGAGAVRRLLA
ncbi:TIGR02391 family protein [Streptomyces canus]|uniref:TIGR02391 family protein n=1 Tax=Streptomyces canus TaxID=58343 RepID=UPI002255F84C|nr:TIGR02391 family protein [Streptomyces canus]MCX4858220.1 TIGR02391 family protein [Streptomyces canus]